MEKLAQAISHILGTELHLNDEKQKVVAYGLAAIFQMSIIFIVITILGSLGGFYPEALVLFLGVGLLRKSTGGNHAPTFNTCLFVSITSILLMAAFSHYIPNKENEVFFFIFIIVSYILDFWLVYKYAPVDSPNKPIKNPQKIKRLRKSSILTVCIYFILTVLSISNGLIKPSLFHIGISLTLATLWQAVTLTKFSKGFFNIFTIVKIVKEE